MKETYFAVLDWQRYSTRDRMRGDMWKKTLQASANAESIGTDKKWESRPLSLVFLTSGIFAKG